LVRAREKAAECRQIRTDGLDPIEIRNAKRRQTELDALKPTLSFQHYAERFISAHKVSWRHPRTEKRWKRSLATYAYPILNHREVPAIDAELVMKVLEQDVDGPDDQHIRFWDAKPVMAEIVRSRIENVLDYWRVLCRKQGEKLAPWENPARLRDNLQILLPSRSRIRPVRSHPALDYGDIRGFIDDLRRRNDLGAVPLEIQILTLARPGRMLTGMAWPEIDFTQEVWSIPGWRMKTGRDFRVPLSKPALAILKKLYASRQGDFVFPGKAKNGSIGDNLANSLVKRMGRGDATAHGFRATFDTWGAEETDFSFEIRETALAHSIGSKNSDVRVSARVYAAYQRGDLLARRRQLMQAWAEYCTASVPERLWVMRPPMRRRRDTVTDWDEFISKVWTPLVA